MEYKGKELLQATLEKGNVFRQDYLDSINSFIESSRSNATITPAPKNSPPDCFLNGAFKSQSITAILNKKRVTQ